MKIAVRKVFKSFSLELPIYAALAIIYVLVVLHYLGRWLFELFTNDRKIYAAVALGLIVGQGYVLELITRRLFGLIGMMKAKKGK